MSFPEFSDQFGSLPDLKAAGSKQKATACPISSLFRYSSRMFRMSAPSTKYSRGLFIVTYRDDPCANIPQDRTISTQLARDLNANQVPVDVIPVGLDEKAVFDMSAFYGPTVSDSASIRLNNALEEEDDTSILEKQKSHVIRSATGLLTNFKEELRRKANQFRVLQKTLLQLVPGVVVSVAVFLIIRDTKKPTPVLVKADEAIRPVYSETKWINSITGELLAKEELQKYYEFQKLRIRLTQDEVTFLKSEASVPIYEAFPKAEKDPAVRMIVLGYKPIHMIDRYRLSMGQIYFIFPIDQEVENSVAAVSSLVSSLWYKGKVAIISWQYRSNSAPRLFAGVPQHTEDKIGGLFLIALPYADDIRKIVVNEEPNDATNEPNLQLFCNLLEKLDLNDRGISVPQIPNPTLDRFYAGLEALALGQDEIKGFKDHTLPDDEFFESIKDDLAKLQDAFGLNRGQKRSLPSKSTATTIAHVDVAPLEKLAKEGKLQSLLVPQLKTALAGLGLRVSGKKSELIARLEAHLRAHTK